MDFFKHYPRKKIDLATIEEHYKLGNYQELYHFIQEALKTGVIIPIKSSGSNGKKLALYKTYRIQVTIENEATLREELLYLIHPKLKNDYYLTHLTQYSNDREAILKLSSFFQTKSSDLEHPTAINERSFQIWQQEKFLLEEGNRLLKNVGLSMTDLNVYETAEPLAYFSACKETP